jgi:hypothetical protein
MLWSYISGRRSRKNFIAVMSYLEVFYAKEVQIGAKLGTNPDLIEAEDRLTMIDHPSWLSPTLKGALHMAKNTDNPNTLKYSMLIIIQDLIVQLAKVGGLRDDQRFIVNHLYNFLGLDQPLTRKGLDLHCDAVQDPGR